MAIRRQHGKQFAGPGRGRRGLKTTEPFRDYFRRRNSSVEQNVLIFFFYLLFDPIESPLANNEFQSSLVLVGAIPIFAKDADHSLALVHNPFYRYKLVQHLRLVRQGPDPAPPHPSTRT